MSSLEFWHTNTTIVGISMRIVAFKLEVKLLLTLLGLYNFQWNQRITTDLQLKYTHNMKVLGLKPRGPINVMLGWEVDW